MFNVRVQWINPSRLVYQLSHCKRKDFFANLCEAQKEQNVGHDDVPVLHPTLCVPIRIRAHDAVQIAVKASSDCNVKWDESSSDFIEELRP